MVNTCDNCGFNTNKLCAGCGRIFYCNKNCQSAKWSTHKLVCGKSRRDTYKKYVDYIKFTNRKIIGNILIMLAHGSSAHNSSVLVEIDESIEEFVEGQTLHFATISLALHDREPVISDGAASTANTVNILYMFRDFSTVITRGVPNIIESIKNKYPLPPPDKWTITFES